MKKTILLLSAVAMMCACSHKELPEGVIDGERMAAFLADAYTLESYNSVESKSDNDTLSITIRAAYDDMLRRHKLTRDEVEYSMQYYANHPDQYRPILEEVGNILNKEAEKPRD
ncbi:MAG: DUF4296 domain-containing protein [Bacteroidales bacterium]|nr:DUF4296 domain-containing protein [Bacteroidales bacterium]